MNSSYGVPASVRKPPVVHIHPFLLLLPTTLLLLLLLPATLSHPTHPSAPLCSPTTLGLATPLRACEPEPACQLASASSSPAWPQTDIHVTNGAAYPIDLLYVDERSEEHPFQTIQPGDTAVQTSYSTHVWRVRHGVSRHVMLELTPDEPIGVLGHTILAHRHNAAVHVTHCTPNPATRPHRPLNPFVNVLGGAGNGSGSGGGDGVGEAAGHEAGAPDQGSRAAAAPRGLRALRSTGLFVPNVGHGAHHEEELLRDTKLRSDDSREEMAYGDASRNGNDDVYSIEEGSSDLLDDQHSGDTDHDRSDLHATSPHCVADADTTVYSSNTGYVPDVSLDALEQSLGNHIAAVSGALVAINLDLTSDLVAAAAASSFTPPTDSAKATGSGGGGGGAYGSTQMDPRDVARRFAIRLGSHARRLQIGASRNVTVVLYVSVDEQSLLSSQQASSRKQSNAKKSTAKSTTFAEEEQSQLQAEDEHSDLARRVANIVWIVTTAIKRVREALSVGVPSSAKWFWGTTAWTNRRVAAAWAAAVRLGVPGPVVDHPTHSLAVLNWLGGGTLTRAGSTSSAISNGCSKEYQPLGELFVPPPDSRERSFLIGWRPVFSPLGQELHTNTEDVCSALGLPPLPEGEVVRAGTGWQHHRSAGMLPLVTVLVPQGIEHPSFARAGDGASDYSDSSTDRSLVNHGDDTRMDITDTTDSAATSDDTAEAADAEEKRWGEEEDGEGQMGTPHLCAANVAVEADCLREFA